VRRSRPFAVLLFITTVIEATSAFAHPSPFSYLDIHLGRGAMAGTLVLHDIDVAGLLGIPPDKLDAAAITAHKRELHALVAERLTLVVDGRLVRWDISDARPRPDRLAVELTWRAEDVSSVGRLTITAALFPDDPAHQTFVNVYEESALTRQEVLNRSRTSVDFYTSSRQGAFAVVRAFTASGVHHIAIGPDHILFVIGLLLLGGSVPRLIAIVSAFTLGHSVTLSLATLGILNAPPHLVEPAIALSIVYVGADNLLVGTSGRDVRPWIALFFGLVHGFGFASVLRETGLPPRALGLSLFAFNLGVEIGQAIIVVAVAWLLRLVHARNAVLGRRIATAGSLVVVAAGAFWFIERVF
jgi:HupE/UreJ protein